MLSLDGHGRFENCCIMPKPLMEGSEERNATQRYNLMRGMHRLAGKQGVWMKVATLTACYSICSSMLLILNKVAVTRIPAPSFILACQLGSTALFVKVPPLTFLLHRTLLSAVQHPISSMALPCS